jgi:hypothetical protein
LSDFIVYGELTGEDCGCFLFRACYACCGGGRALLLVVLSLSCMPHQVILASFPPLVHTCFSHAAG